MFAYLSVYGVSRYLLYEKSHFSIGNYLSGIIKVATFRHFNANNVLHTEDLKPFVDISKCNIDDLISPVRKIFNNYCNVTSTALPTKYCQYWEYGRPCVSISIDRSIYDNKEAREIVVNVIRSPCKFIEKEFIDPRYFIFLNEMFRCNKGLDFQYFDVVLVQRNLQSGQKSTVNKHDIIDVYFGNTLISSLIKLISS